MVVSRFCKSHLSRNTFVAIALTLSQLNSTKNLSIKINAKLSNPFHQSSSWTIKGTASEWLKNSNTLVIGYAFAGGKTIRVSYQYLRTLFTHLICSLSAAQGKDGNMVVVASSCVDDDGLSMRHANIVLPKSPYLKPVAAEKLISVRVWRYATSVFY